ncbi:MAG: HlyD family secretion protein, partial [Rhodoferax sp.]|nr:HlyD family secretion protein [Rhodoferax sp.]
QQRMADLVARQFVSAAKFDEARQAAEVAERQVQALELGLQRIAMALGGSLDASPERLPGYQAAQAELDQAQLNLRHTEVRAPLPGVVSRPPKPGQYLAAGASALALVANGTLWVEANFPETELTHVRPGQRVSVRIDTYSDRRWQGVVESLSPATGAEFSVIPAQNATGNWVKIAQRVPVRIRIEPAADAPPLRAGLSAHVDIETGQRRRLLGLSL